MRRVELGGTGIATSCLGFGCASLGSRVGTAEGLRALAAAYEHGVTWLDLAPAYGLGAAETIAAAFLKGKRDRLQVATKVGVAPPAEGGLAALVPVARRAVGALPGLRPALRRLVLGRNRRLPLTGELVRDSLEASLRRLGTDYVDLYALHGAAREDLLREDVRRALEDLLVAGKVRAAAVASDEVAAEAALAAGAPYSVVQLSAPFGPAGENLVGRARGAGFGVVLHSIFGVDGALAREFDRLKADATLREELRATLCGDPRRALGRLLLARALALVPDGVVLASMFSERNRRENLGVAESGRTAEASALLDRLYRAA